jgi:PAS domain S-box-containing protein
LYRASSRISHAVVRSHTRQELLDEIVRVLVESGGFAMAFAAWYDPDSHELMPVARFGDAAGYLDRVHMFGDERPEGQGPAGLAFRSGLCYLCQDFLEDPSTVPWREAAAVSGWHASAAIPIAMGGTPCGVVSAYSLESNIFGPEEASLFEQVATDVSLGLERLDAEEQRRRTQSALAASERRLELAMDAAAIGIYEWDVNTGQLVLDEQSERLFGYAPGGFDGTYATFANHVHPADRAGAEHVMAVARSTRTPFVYEFRIVWPDRSIHWISSRGEFTYDEDGQPDRLYGATFNIDDRKRAEAALHESEQLLQQAVRVSEIGIFYHDHFTDVIYWSPELRAMHGVDAESTVTLDLFYSRVHPYDRERVSELVRRAHDPAGDGLFDVDTRLLLPDGSIRWTSTRSQTFFEGQGEDRHPVRTVGAVSDITESKRSQEEQKTLALVVEMSNEFIGIATLEGNVIYLNNAAMRLVGIKDIEEARQKTIYDFVPESNRVQAVKEIYLTVRKKGLWSGETRLRHFRTGAAIDVDLTAFQIRDDRGTPLYLATVTRDITERKKAAAEKVRLEASLIQAQKMESIGRLAGGVAHDFNNMLTVILGFAGLAKSKVLEPEIARRQLDEIVKAAERSREITRQLLGFSRQQIIAPKPSNLNSIVEDLQNPLARLIGEDIELAFLPKPDLWTALLDSSQINQILINLAANARDAMPEGGRLTVETANVRVTEEYARMQAGSPPGDYVVLAISDTGIGMSRETLAHIFEPFFTTKETGKGTGLGLATVYGIAKQNGGFVSVYSEPGQGATFRVYFPRVVGEGELPQPPRAPARAGVGNVLLVEDDDLVRGVATAALENLGYKPLVAEDPQDALRICAQFGSDIRLVLTDVVMPGMTGAELRDRINALLPDMKVLFMSGYTDDVIVTRGVLKGGVHFIQKPFSIEELGRKIAEILGSVDDGLIV